MARGMKQDRPVSTEPAPTECAKRRLAENATVAVDVCSCGVMQIHLGSLTLRMSPCAVSDLIRVLDRAVQLHAGDAQREPAEHLHSGTPGRPRGQA
jgi:hypothetical protein